MAYDLFLGCNMRDQKGIIFTITFISIKNKSSILHVYPFRFNLRWIGPKNLFQNQYMRRTPASLGMHLRLEITAFSAL